MVLRGIRGGGGGGGEADGGDEGGSGASRAVVDESATVRDVVASRSPSRGMISRRLPSPTPGLGSGEGAREGDADDGEDRAGLRRPPPPPLPPPPPPPSVSRRSRWTLLRRRGTCGICSSVSGAGGGGAGGAVNEDEVGEEEEEDRRPAWAMDGGSGGGGGGVEVVADVDVDARCAPDAKCDSGAAIPAAAVVVAAAILPTGLPLETVQIRGGTNAVGLLFPLAFALALALPLALRAKAVMLDCRLKATGELAAEFAAAVDERELLRECRPSAPDRRRDTPEGVVGVESGVDGPPWLWGLKYSSGEGDCVGEEKAVHLSDVALAVVARFNDGRACEAERTRAW